MPDTLLRTLVDPVPLSPVSLVWLKGRRHPGISAMRAAAKGLTGEASWPEAITGSRLFDSVTALVQSNPSSGSTTHGAVRYIRRPGAV
jgi:hypothetical protein